MYNIKSLAKWWEDGRKYISNWVKDLMYFQVLELVNHNQQSSYKLIWEKKKGFFWTNKL